MPGTICSFCGSKRGVAIYGSPPKTYVKCVVCAGLMGTSPDSVTSSRDVLYAVVSLFHALNLVPVNLDNDEGGS